MLAKLPIAKVASLIRTAGVVLQAYLKNGVWKMFRYRNEAAFSKALVGHLRNKGFFVQRIESGETGKGIPDIYAINPCGTAMWIELKRVHRSTSSIVRIPWRPGQQAWLNEVTRKKQNAFTLACFDDYILQIPHRKLYGNNEVHLSDCVLYSSLRSL